MMVALLMMGCSPDLTPTYAFDPIWIEPDPSGESDISGFHTWQIYGPRWPRHYSDRHYACSVLVALSGMEIECDADEACSIAWELTSELLESDCDPKVAKDPLFLTLSRAGIGGPTLGQGVPWPGATSEGWVDYGNGWEIHGHAYPDALDAGEEVEGYDWDDEQPFFFIPTQSFPL